MMVPRPPVNNRSNGAEGSSERETITLRALESGQTMDVVVLSKRVDRIHVMLGEGTHSVFCELKPTQDARAYVGSAMGREIIYECSRAQVQADIDRGGPAVRDSNAQ
jgi:hypothetical protein